MTPALVKRWLARREHGGVEFKEARRELPRSLFESVCAFLNRDGGVVLLGVDDRGQIVGVEPDALERLTAEIVNLSNNPQKLDPPFILAPASVKIGNRRVLVLQVPASSDVHRCAGVVYDRGNEGDYAVKDPQRIAGMVNRKRGFYSETQVYPHLRLADFAPGILAKARRLIEVRQPGHPWQSLSDKDFLVKAGFWRRDPLTATEGYTLAAGLMFGREEVILSMVPHYRTDAVVRRVNVDRYDDRLDVRVNLVDAYELLMEFVAKHLPDPFHLEGDQRVSLRTKIFREVVSNVLAHREYMDARPATFTIFRDRVEVVNAAHAHGRGPIKPERFAPYSKNPIICRFFRQMGRAEELGSGVLNVSKYLPVYAKGAKPRFVEGDPFVTVIPLPVDTGVNGSAESRDGTGVKARGKTGVASSEKSSEEGSEKSSEKIISVIARDSRITAREIGARIGLTPRAVEKQISKLQAAGRLRRVGPDKGGHWEVISGPPP
ncbi:MAG: hypothetical protein A3K19_13325 [Lentisphaerae bacterium RIFOXYB12_FULL_65_16]|nr:MAG: hypothetical protein A3K18_01190 [Lentisphaerae bacterium RIFOXYA12_64_32]OGV90270.1 MAG: hypothetical protein A3K19_13325 [Lentisphaerae bacterium RIFOXYB12_FULL_65_16]